MKQGEISIDKISSRLDFGRTFGFIKGLYSRPYSAFGASIFLVFCIIALIGPYIAPYGANEQIVTEARLPPSPDHLFGTDNLGRDVYSRVLLGARDILALAGLGTLIAVMFGTGIGLLSGYLGSWFDEGVSSLVQVAWPS